MSATVTILIKAGNWVGQAWFILGKSMMTVSRSVFQEDLLHDFLRDWSEADQSVVPQIVLMAIFGDGCNNCLHLVTWNLPLSNDTTMTFHRWYGMALQGHQPALSAPLDASCQVSWTCMGTRSSSTAGSSPPWTLSLSTGLKDLASEDGCKEGTECLNLICVHCH